VDAQAPETIFTLLVAGGLIVTVAALALGGPDLRAELASMSLALAAVVAVGATLGSLYFSEVRNFTPCELCWFQRIAMYPLAVLLPIAAWRRDDSMRLYATVLAGLGAAVSIYHYQLQLFPDQGSSCSADAPCSFQWIEVFGFVSIPLLALGSFSLVIVLLITPRIARPAQEASS